MNYWNLIPWSISLVSLILVFITFFRNSKKDIKNEVQEDDQKLKSIAEGLLKANMKLDQVCGTTTETRSDIKALNKDLALIDRRLTVVETDLKTAFVSIDELKKGVS